MANHYRTQTMDRLFKLLLVLSNLALVAAFVFFLQLSQKEQIVEKNIETPEILIPAPSIELDLAPITQEMRNLTAKISQLDYNIRRLNITTVQFDYLSSEIEELAKTSQIVETRLLEIETIPQKSRKEETVEAFEKLKDYQTRLNNSIKQRKELRKQLVIELENALTEKSDQLPQEQQTPPAADSSSDRE